MFGPSNRIITVRWRVPAVSSGAGSRRAWWAGAGSGGDGWVRALRELVRWAGAPAAGARRLQPALLRALHAAPHAAAQLASPPPQRQLAVYLLLMLRHQHALAEGGQAALELGVSDWARGWAMALQDGLHERLGAALPDEGAALLRADEERWARPQHAARQRAHIGRSVSGRTIDRGIILKRLKHEITIIPFEIYESFVLVRCGPIS